MKRHIVLQRFKEAIETKDVPTLSELIDRMSDRYANRAEISQELVKKDELLWQEAWVDAKAWVSSWNEQEWEQWKKWTIDWHRPAYHAKQQHEMFMYAPANGQPLVEINGEEHFLERDRAYGYIGEIKVPDKEHYRKQSKLLGRGVRFPIRKVVVEARVPSDEEMFAKSMMAVDLKHYSKRWAYGRNNALFWAPWVMNLVPKKIKRTDLEQVETPIQTAPIESFWVKQVATMYPVLSEVTVGENKTWEALVRVFLHEKNEVPPNNYNSHSGWETEDASQTEEGHRVIDSFIRARNGKTLNRLECTRILNYLFFEIAPKDKASLLVAHPEIKKEKGFREFCERWAEKWLHVVSIAPETATLRELLFFDLSNGYREVVKQPTIKMLEKVVVNKLMVITPEEWEETVEVAQEWFSRSRYSCDGVELVLLMPLFHSRAVRGCDYAKEIFSVWCKSMGQTKIEEDPIFKAVWHSKTQEEKQKLVADIESWGLAQACEVDWKSGIKRRKTL